MRIHLTCLSTALALCVFATMPTNARAQDATNDASSATQSDTSQPRAEHADNPSSDHATAHARASTPRTPSPLSVPLDEATLASLPVAAVVASAHGKTLSCQGVALSALLRKAGALTDEPLRGPALASYVLVDARDGYRVVYSLAELDPTQGDHGVVLANRCDGKPLDDATGPLRLIAPQATRPARWVRQVESITVVAAP